MSAGIGKGKKRKIKLREPDITEPGQKKKTDVREIIPLR